MKIGPHDIPKPVFLAPMAGITDKPFRTLCRSLGAGHAISEMVSSKHELRHSRKTQARLDHAGEPGLIHVQIAGSEPRQMADAARYNVDLGAELIDINMGCPAKKVCNKLAGSSLLRDESLVARILESVVKAVDVPVTLKTRTGWDANSRNVSTIGRIAESVGISCMTLHGRTRNDFYNGAAEFDSLKRLRDTVSLPLIANGDIQSAAEASRILKDTGADAVMIGRGAQKQPWLPGAIARFLCDGVSVTEPSIVEKRDILISLVKSLHHFYGNDQGVRMARKHISWQLECFRLCANERRDILKATDPDQQIAHLSIFFDRQMNILEAA